MLYTVLITSRKLRHYFETYPIEVVTEFPLGEILRNKDANGRIIKWTLELSPYSLEFRSRTTIKSQALVDCRRNMVGSPPRGMPTVVDESVKVRETRTRW
jgi:hypothetical protein